MQSELRRVGCYSGNADGDWDAASQRSLSQFNRNAGMKLDVKTANADTLDAIKQKQSRVCPLVCEHGFKADGDHCTKIVCAEGSFVNDDNECEKRRARSRWPSATRTGKPASSGSKAGTGTKARSGTEAGYGQAFCRHATGPGLSATGRPLTGLERAQGCNSNQAIMSGVCPDNRQRACSGLQLKAQLEIALAAMLTISATSAVL